MFLRNQTNAKADEAITAALDALAQQDPTSDEYRAILEHIAKLEKLKSQSGLKPPSMDTVLVVGANLFGILWLARYERENVIRSKSALGLVIKPKLPAA
jgi:hypothetical protein